MSKVASLPSPPHLIPRWANFLRVYWHCTVLHCTALQRSTVHCNVMQCTALHCSAVQCSSSIQTVCLPAYLHTQLTFDLKVSPRILLLSSKLLGIRFQTWEFSCTSQKLLLGIYIGKFQVINGTLDPFTFPRCLTNICSIVSWAFKYLYASIDYLLTERFETQCKVQNAKVNGFLNPILVLTRKLMYHVTRIKTCWF